MKTKVMSTDKINDNVLTCIILSSETEQITQGSLGFHEKSDIFAVWPP